MRPPELSRASSAFVQDAGLPIRIAVAIVVRVLHDLAGDDRRGAGGLEAPHARGLLREAASGFGVLAVALPVGGDVAGVADRQAVDVGGVAEHVDDLERRRLLALDAELVDAVDQAHRVVDRQLAGQREAVVEVALDLQQLGAVHERLGQLAHRDLALRHEDGAGDAGARGVGGGAGAGVAGGGADDRLRALLDGLADGHRHAAVLERAGRVGALDLEVDVAPGAAGELRRRQQRGVALLQGHDRRASRSPAAARGRPRSAPASPP